MPRDPYIAARLAEIAGEPLPSWRQRLDRVLLAAEIGLVLVFLWLVTDLWFTLRALDQAVAQLQAQEKANSAEIVPATTGGKRAPSAEVDGQPDGRSHSNRGSSVQKAAPAAGAPSGGAPGADSQAQRIRIPALGIDSTVRVGLTQEQLRWGVGQYPASPGPGERGNLVLSAHNDAFGAIFRHLDELEPGDEIYVSSGSTVYTYTVRETLVVKPDDVWVTLPTPSATATLISCYPYLIDNRRIVVFADYVDAADQGS